MKNKKATIITSIALIALIIVALAMATYAWYIDDSLNYNVDLLADSIASIYFTSSDAEVEGTLIPAIAMEGAVADNKYMDVTREYDETDPTPSWVSQAASQITYWTNFVFRGTAPIIITYDTFVSLANNPSYFVDNSEFVIEIDFFVEEEQLIKDGNKTTIYPREDTDITIVDVKVNMYFAYVDELVDPILKEQAIFTTINITRVYQFLENQNIDISFDTDSAKAQGVMSPAIAMSGALLEGKYIDIKRTYNASDTEPSWIETAATPTIFSTEIMYMGTNSYLVECSWNISKDGILLDPSIFLVEIVLKDSNNQQLIPDENEFISLPASSTIIVEISVYYALVEEVMQETYSHLLSEDFNILIKIKAGGS